MFALFHSLISYINIMLISYLILFHVFFFLSNGCSVFQKTTDMKSFHFYFSEEESHIKGEMKFKSGSLLFRIMVYVAYINNKNTNKSLWKMI